MRAGEVAKDGDAVGVMLSNRPDRVWLLREDYERIIDLYGLRAWAWSPRARYVRLQPAGGVDLSIARLVANKEGKIAYWDGNRINLLRENFVLGRPGYGSEVGTANAAARVVPSPIFRPPSRPSVRVPYIPRSHPTVVGTVKRSTTM
jgi:hypothetical protein